MLRPADPDTRVIKLCYPRFLIGSGGWEVRRVVVVRSTPAMLSRCCSSSFSDLLGGGKGSGNDKLLICLIV